MYLILPTTSPLSSGSRFRLYDMPALWHVQLRCQAEYGKISSMNKTVLVLTVTVTLMWTVTLAVAFAHSPPACASTRSGLGIANPTNCAWVGSCGPKLNRCFRLGFGGGSQYVFDNHIPACLKEGVKDCYAVRCRVKQYTDEACQILDDDTYVSRTGCKKP